MNVIEARRARLLAKANEVVDNLCNNGSPYREYEETLDFGNCWTMVESRLIRMMDDFMKGLHRGEAQDKNALAEKIADLLLNETDKDFLPHNPKTIFLSEFECEHDGDMEGEKSRITEAGGVIVKSKADYSEETGYVFFTIPTDKVSGFEKQMGNLRYFPKCGVTA